MIIQEKMFSVNINGCYCGFLVKEPLAKKLAKLAYKQAQEIKKIIANNLDDAEIDDWDLVYPQGKQMSFHYFVDATNEEKLKRLELYNTIKTLTYQDLVIKVNGDYSENLNTAKAEAIEYFTNMGEG